MEHNFTIKYHIEDTHYSVTNDDTGETYNITFKSKDRAEAFCNEVASRLEKSKEFTFPYKVVLNANPSRNEVRGTPPAGPSDPTE